MNKNNNIDNIIFYFPHMKIGGVSSLFIESAKLIKDEFNTFLADYKNGQMAKNIPPNVKFLDVETITKFPENSLIIFQSFHLWNLRDIEKFPLSTKFLFWNLHPNNLYPYLVSNQGNQIKKILHEIMKPFSFFRKRKIQSLVRYLKEKDSIYFMDYENYLTTEKLLQVEISDKLILPLFMKQNNQIIKNQSISNLSVAYIGRLVDFKVFPLIHLLERLNRILITKIDFHIVGEGNFKNNLLEKSVELEKINLIFHGTIDLNESSEIFNEINLGVGMGLSALEFASRGIPTILLDYSYQPIRKVYKFNFIFESIGYNLARDINLNMLYEEKCTLKNTLNILEQDYNSLSALTNKWFVENFSPSLWKNKFMKIVRKNNSSIYEMKKLGMFKLDFISCIYKVPLSIFIKNNLSYFKNL